MNTQQNLVSIPYRVSAILERPPLICGGRENNERFIERTVSIPYRVSAMSRRKT